MITRYERLAAEASGTVPRQGARWERISERQLGRILSPLEIRVCLPGGRIVKTITGWYRAVLTPTLTEMQASRVTLRDTRGDVRGWGYAGLPFRVETAVNADDGGLMLILSGPWVKCEHTVYRFSELPKLEARVHRLAIKHSLFERLILH